MTTRDHKHDELTKLVTQALQLSDELKIGAVALRLEQARLLLLEAESAIEVPEG